MNNTKDLGNFIRSTIKESYKLDKLAKNESLKIHEDGDQTIVYIAGVNAARKYGAQTKWCVSARGCEGEDAMFDWIDRGYYLFFAINKFSKNKYAIAYYSEDDWIVWDQLDEVIAVNDEYEEYGDYRDYFNINMHYAVGMARKFDEEMEYNS